MNYRHAYHAGYSSDVLKHTILTGLIERLLDKPAPLFVLDTHAGIGIYDLTGEEAQKTGEWQAGIGRLIAAPTPMADRYMEIVRGLNREGGLVRYPGSPAVAATLLRPSDRLVLSELHPDDADRLRFWAKGMSGVETHRRDGYEAIGAFLPPRERRGLVLVDPPYEAPDEFERLAEAVIAGHRRWPAGRWLIWHPVKDRAPVWRLEETLIAAGIPNILSVELLTEPVDGIRLAGSGVLLINPPYRFEGWLSALLPELQAALAPEQGSHALRWLAGS